jgi:hypothetical protein
MISQAIKRFEIAGEDVSYNQEQRMMVLKNLYTFIPMHIIPLNVETRKKAVLPQR